MAKYEPLIERFDKKYIPEPNSGCWLWLGGVHFTRGGGPYGAIGNERGFKPVMLSAHRAAYQLYKGDIPVNFDVDHTCQNTLCVNPEHLQAITHQNHAQLTWNRIKKGECKRGHKMTASNTWVGKTGAKQCRLCNNARAREIRAKNRAARRKAA